MVPLPKKRTSRARQGERRSHLGLQASILIDCPQCHAPKMPYHACPTCGTYDGREVISVESSKKKSSE